MHDVCNSMYTTLYICIIDGSGRGLNLIMASRHSVILAHPQHGISCENNLATRKGLRRVAFFKNTKQCYLGSAKIFGSLSLT